MEVLSFDHRHLQVPQLWRLIDLGACVSHIQCVRATHLGCQFRWRAGCHWRRGSSPPCRHPQGDIIVDPANCSTNHESARRKGRSRRHSRRSLTTSPGWKSPMWSLADSSLLWPHNSNNITLCIFSTLPEDTTFYKKLERRIARKSEKSKKTKEIGIHKKKK